MINSDLFSLVHLHSLLGGQTSNLEIDESAGPIAIRHLEGNSEELIESRSPNTADKIGFLGQGRVLFA